MPDVIYFVIPCYNEQEVLTQTSAVLGQALRRLMSIGLAARESRVLFVDDGSSDGTWQLIESFSQKDMHFTGIRLSHNRGHQNALLAGMQAAYPEADAVITLDADLQDDVNVLEQFLKAYYGGCEIVYGVRENRRRDSFFKRFSAEAFYRLLARMGADIVYNHADYRLMSHRAVGCLLEFPEVNLFLRGIIPLMGFQSCTVPYVRGERKAGTSKYPFGKMLGFAMDGITSFSVRPIRLISFLGALVLLASAVAFVVVLATKLLGYTVAGWSSMQCSIWFLGGVQMLSLGVIGEYVGKIYAEVKHRPRYFIEKSLLDPPQGK